MVAHDISDLPAFEPACLSDETLKAFEQPASERIAAHLKDARESVRKAKEEARADGDEAGASQFWIEMGRLDGMRNVYEDKGGRG
jgi:hypothetical protein